MIMCDMDNLKIGSLVKYKNDFAIVTDINTTMGQNPSGKVLMSDGTYDYEYKIFVFQENQHHAWIYGSDLRLVSDPFEEYRVSVKKELIVNMIEKQKIALEQLKWLLAESNESNDLEYHGVSVKDAIITAIETLENAVE